MQTIIRRFTRRAVQYEHRDGTADLAMGVWLLAFALCMRLSQGAVPMWRWAATFYGLMFAVWAAVHFGTRYIRRRLVYPRSGYAEMRIKSRPWKLALTGGLAAVAAAALARFFAGTHSSGISAPLGMGLFVGVAMLIGALRVRMRKFAAFAMLSVAVGFALQFIEPTLESGAFWYFFVMGIAFLITGALTLYLYVRRTQAHNLEAE